jgi:hypothetical protein
MNFEKNMLKKFVPKKSIFKKTILKKQILTKPILKKQILTKPILKKQILIKPIFKKQILTKPIFKKQILTKPISKQLIFKKNVSQNLLNNRSNIDYTINTTLVDNYNNTQDKINYIFNNIYIIDKTFIWESDNNIELTVALPAYNNKRIIYLALESLKNQTNINFNWELIVIEEQGLSYNLIKKYQNIIPGCKRIIYIGINTQILLIEKWKIMSLLSSNTSKVYVMQASDDYSPPKRLFIHYEHFKNTNCYYSTQPKGIFYNLKNKKKIIYDGTTINNYRNHLNMATRTSDIRNISIKHIKKGIDGYIFNYIKNTHKLYNKQFIFTDTQIDKNNWKYGFCTDGANTISKHRTDQYTKPKKIFRIYNKTDKLYIPTYINKFIEIY